MVLGWEIFRSQIEKSQNEMRNSSFSEARNFWEISRKFRFEFLFEALKRRRKAPNRSAIPRSKAERGRPTLERKTAWVGGRNFFHFFRSEPILGKSCRTKSGKPKISFFRFRLSLRIFAYIHLPTVTDSIKNLVRYLEDCHNTRK